MTRVTLLYFAALREAAGTAMETVDTAAPTLRALYDEARTRHRLPFPSRQLRDAVSDANAGWYDAGCVGIEIASYATVSGG